MNVGFLGLRLTVKVRYSLDDALQPSVAASVRTRPFHVATQTPQATAHPVEAFRSQHACPVGVLRWRRPAQPKSVMACPTEAFCRQRARPVGVFCGQRPAQSKLSASNAPVQSKPSAGDGPSSRSLLRATRPPTLDELRRGSLRPRFAWRRLKLKVPFTKGTTRGGL